jgi:branched-chain amino acid transport system substrate-binding protein
MAQKNDTPALILSLLVTLFLLGAGVWWFSNRLNLSGAHSTSPGTGSNPTTPSEATAADRISSGQQSFFLNDASSDKQAGIEALAAGRSEDAIGKLTAALQQNRNDPEALIYLNNARAGSTYYSIAVSVPIGSDANAALEILRGVAQAQTEVNQTGGINGVPLQVVIANDDNDPATARQVAQELVNDSTILGSVGHYASDVTLAAAEVYEAGKLVTISPVSTSVKLSGFGQYTFRTVPSDYIAARSLANYMTTSLNQQNAAVFYNSQSGYSQSIKSEFTTALSLGGGQVTSEFDLSSASFSAGRSVEQAIAQGATVLVLLPNTGTLDRALQVVQINQRQLPLLAGDDVYAPTTLDVGAAQAADMVVAVPWHILANAESAFVRQSRQLWGGDVNWRSAMAYDAAQALIAALKPNPTREGVQAALSDPNFSAQGASAVVRFLPSGDRNQTVQLVKIEPGSRSGYGYDFVPVP